MAADAIDLRTPHERRSDNLSILVRRPVPTLPPTRFTKTVVHRLSTPRSFHASELDDDDEFDEDDDAASRPSERTPGEPTSSNSRPSADTSTTHPRNSQDSLLADSIHNVQYDEPITDPVVHETAFTSEDPPESNPDLEAQTQLGALHTRSPDLSVQTTPSRAIYPQAGLRSRRNSPAGLPAVDTDSNHLQPDGSVTGLEYNDSFSDLRLPDSGTNSRTFKTPPVFDLAEPDARLPFSTPPHPSHTTQTGDANALGELMNDFDDENEIDEPVALRSVSNGSVPRDFRTALPPELGNNLVRLESSDSDEAYPGDQQINLDAPARLPFGDETRVAGEDRSGLASSAPRKRSAEKESVSFADFRWGGSRGSSRQPQPQAAETEVGRSDPPTRSVSRDGAARMRLRKVPLLRRARWTKRHGPAYVAPRGSSRQEHNADEKARPENTDTVLNDRQLHDESVNLMPALGASFTDSMSSLSSSALAELTSAPLTRADAETQPHEGDDATPSNESMYRLNQPPSWNLRDDEVPTPPVALFGQRHVMPTHPTDGRTSDAAVDNAARSRPRVKLGTSDPMKLVRFDEGSEELELREAQAPLAFEDGLDALPDCQEWESMPLPGKCVQGRALSLAPNSVPLFVEENGRHPRVAVVEGRCQYIPTSRAASVGSPPVVDSSASMQDTTASSILSQAAAVTSVAAQTRCFPSDPYTMQARFDALAAVGKRSQCPRAVSDCSTALDGALRARAAHDTQPSEPTACCRASLGSGWSTSTRRRTTIGLGKQSATASTTTEPRSRPVSRRSLRKPRSSTPSCDASLDAYAQGDVCTKSCAVLGAIPCGGNLCDEYVSEREIGEDIVAALQMRDRLSSTEGTRNSTRSSVSPISFVTATSASSTNASSSMNARGTERNSLGSSTCSSTGGPLRSNLTSRVSAARHGDHARAPPTARKYATFVPDLHAPISSSADLLLALSREDTAERRRAPKHRSLYVRPTMRPRSRADVAPAGHGM